MLAAGWHVSNVPNCDIADVAAQKENRPTSALQFYPADRRSGGHQCRLWPSGDIRSSCSR